MVTREQLINKLRELGYRFKRDAWRVTFFKKGTHRAPVPKRDLLEDETARQILRQCGESREGIEEFIRNCRN